MKFLTLVMVSLFSCMAFSAENIIETLESHNIKEYYCDITGTFRVNASDVNFTSTEHIHASEEAEAIKYCLNAVKAVKLGSGKNVYYQGKISDFGTVKINSIRIRHSDN